MIKLLPIAMMLMSVGASLVYFADGDLRRAIYWLAAATLTTCVTLE